MSVDITEEVEALSKTLNLPDADVDDVHDCLRLPRLLTTNTQQLEILVTTPKKAHFKITLNNKLH